MVIRIVEIASTVSYTKLACPYCRKNLQLGITLGGHCTCVTTACKFCKRILIIHAEEEKQTTIRYKTN